MKKLIMFAVLFAFAAPFVMADSIKINPKIVFIDGIFESFKELPPTSQNLVTGFLDNLQKAMKETELKKAVLPDGVEDTDAIDAILPFITGVEQDYYALAGKDAQATRFAGNLLYTSRFQVKNGSFTIPEFIVKYRSYIQTRTDLDAFYNDLFEDAQASK